MPVPHPTISPAQQLVDAINRLYQRRLTVEQVRFGNPELITDQVQDISEPESRNSRVEFTDLSGQPYEFSTMLHFNRLSLGALFLRRDKNFDGEINNTHDLLAAVSQRVGFTVSEEDIVEHEIDWNLPYPFTLLLVANPRSLLLIGDINLTLTGP